MQMAGRLEVDAKKPFRLFLFLEKPGKVKRLDILDFRPRHPRFGHCKKSL